MQRRKICNAMNREYGVRVAHIAGVCFAGVRGAGRGRTGPSDKGCNRSGINDLKGSPASTQMSKYLHRHIQGEKEKAIVPKILRFPGGTGRVEREAGKWHLISHEVYLY